MFVSPLSSNATSMPTAMKSSKVDAGALLGIVKVWPLVDDAVRYQDTVSPQVSGGKAPTYSLGVPVACRSTLPELLADA